MHDIHTVYIISNPTYLIFLTKILRLDYPLELEIQKNHMSLHMSFKFNQLHRREYEGY